MACYSPLQGWQSRYASANGKHQIVFNRSAGFVDKPMIVPCGVCIGCRIDKSRHWAIRCVHESKLHDKNCFITLTYDDEHLPVDLSLDKVALQLFFKRLRKSVGQVRFYACGEYGEKSFRPHYHAVLFGQDFSSDRKQHSKNHRNDIIFVSDSLTKLWPYGFSTIGDFNYSTAAYVARYVMKKYYGKNSDAHYQRVNPYTGELYQLQPEFSTMSLKPGIGSAWFDKYKRDTFPSDFLVHDGKKHSVPRFYTDKLKKGDESMYKTIKFKRKKALINNPDVSPDRLRVREECKLSSLKNLRRSLND